MTESYMCHAALLQFADIGKASGELKVVSLNGLYRDEYKFSQSKQLVYKGYDVQIIIGNGQLKSSFLVL